jgi:Tfp pilus assembly protein PilN
MKPVNLMPPDSPVAVKATAGKPNMGLIGGIAVGLVAVVGVGGYFAMARVDSVKSEADAANQRAQQASSETQATRAQIQSIGQPVVDSDKQLAQGTEQVLISAYTERYDFVLLAKELRAIMDPNGWYESIDASSVGGGEDESGKAVTIVGYMPTKELAAGYDQRVNGTRSLADAEFSSLETVHLTTLKSKRPGIYWKFTLTANLVDTKAPYAGDAGGAAGADGTAVGDSGDSGTLTLSLDPEPKAASAPKKQSAPAEPAKPKNPFDVAASAARGGAK